MARPRQRNEPGRPPRRRGWVVLMLVALVVASAAAIAQTWTNLRAIEYGYRISEASRQRTRLRDANRKLRVELALLKRPERVTRLSAKMGLNPPEPNQVRRLRLPPGQGPRRPAPASGAAVVLHQPHGPSLAAEGSPR